MAVAQTRTSAVMAETDADRCFFPTNLDRGGAERFKLLRRPMAARYDFKIDDETRSIRITSSGEWTIQDFDRYSTDFVYHLKVARQRFGSAKVLIDGRSATTKDTRVRIGLAGLSKLFDEPGDRFALVTSSSLRKQQAARDGLPASGMVFISIGAAKTWLFAFDCPGI